METPKFINSKNTIFFPYRKRAKSTAICITYKISCRDVFRDVPIVNAGIIFIDAQTAVYFD